MTRALPHQSLQSFEAPASRRTLIRSTLIGAAAIIMWSTLALLTTMTGRVPPFQLVAMSFGIAFAVTLARWLMRGDATRQLPALATSCVATRRRRAVWLPLLLFHRPAQRATSRGKPCQLPLAAVNRAFRDVASWTAFAVVAPRRGALGAGRDGAADRQRRAFRIFSGLCAGYGAAFACAIIWAAYSVLSRLLAHVPTEAVGAFCGATAVLAAGLSPRFRADGLAAGWTMAGRSRHGYRARSEPPSSLGTSA